jgi:hypothetical protein
MHADPETGRWHQHIRTMVRQLTEAQRRCFVGMLSLQPNSPTDSELAQITGLDPKTIRRGRREVAAAGPTDVPARQRRGGGGRLAAEKKTRCSRS